MRLGVCTHVWRYHRLLSLHLSSFILHPPSPAKISHLEIAIFHTLEDEATCRTLEWFAEYAAQSWHWPANVKLRRWAIDRGRLLRRGIGRNIYAKANDCDRVWYADVDHAAGPGCLDAIPAAVAATAGPLAYARIVHKSRTHEIGDAAIQRVERPGIYAIDPSEFEPTIMRRSIGGFQLIRGDILRERGYLPADSRHLRPARSWRRTFCDTAARGYLADGGRGEPIDLPNLYRIRHSQYGRKHEGCEN